MRQYLVMLPLILMACLQVSCNFTPEMPTREQELLAKFKATTSTLQDINVTLLEVIERKTVRIEVDSAAPPELFSVSKSPSELYAALLAQPIPAHARAFDEFLNAAEAMKPIRGVYQACSSNAPVDQIPYVLQASSSRQRLAKRLDPVVRIEIGRCNEVPLTESQRAFARIPENQRNVSKAIASALGREKYEAMYRQFKISPSEIAPLMVGQAYMFEEVKDSKIEISPFLAQGTQKAFARVAETMRPHAKRFPNATLVFDRYKTPQGVVLQKQRNGWFNANAVGETLYVSPTVVRAALIACSSKISFFPAVIYQLENEDYPRYKDGRIAAADFAWRLQGIDKSLARVDECLLEQLGYLFAHELAHTMLEIHVEEQADCIARAAMRDIGKPTPGVFGTLIFENAVGPNAETLGSRMSALQELQCRAMREATANQEPRVGLALAVESCVAASVVCQR